MDGVGHVAGEAKILVVDEDRVTMQLLTDMLARGGYRRISTTHDPERAVQLFRGVQPDLVLLDLGIAVSDGLEVLRQLHDEIAADDHVPILVVSGDASDEPKLNGLVLGANDFITKPVDVVETMLRIRNHLETRFHFLALRQTIELFRGMYG